VMSAEEYQTMPRLHLQGLHSTWQPNVMTRERGVTPAPSYQPQLLHGRANPPSQDIRSHEHQTKGVYIMAVSATLSFLMEQFDKRVADKSTREKFYHDVVEFSYHQPFIAVGGSVYCLFWGQLTNRATT